MNRQIKWTHSDGRVVYYPRKDAKEPLLFAVTNKDIAKAKTLKGYADPNCCVAACAVRRQQADSIVFRDVAYMLQIHKGKSVAVRYRLGGALRRAVSKFDEGKGFPTGTYNLLAPTNSQTLSAKRERNNNPPLTSRKIRKHTKFSARGRVTPLS